jgi:hypothetical protein
METRGNYQYEGFHGFPYHGNPWQSGGLLLGIGALLSMKIPVFMHTLMTYANAMIKVTEFEVLFAKGQVSRGWYYGFYYDQRREL